jgi:outer membrane protein OmpA-like peptidoglycan-associated protein
MRKLGTFGLIVGLWIVFSPGRALAGDEYDDSQSHPLRVTAYLMHPAGVAIEWLLARPFHWLVSATPTQEYIFGHRPHPPMFDERVSYDFGVDKRVYTVKPAAAPRKRFQEPMAERVTIQEVPVEKVVIKEVPQVAEVERVVFPDIAFQFNSNRLTDLGRGRAFLVAQKLKEKTDVMVTIEGHADSTGNEEYNRALGLRRDETIKGELVNLGIDPSRLSSESFGESKPLIEQETEWARAVNRRVEFKATVQ